MSRRKILIISPFLYGDFSSDGGGVLCFAQLKHLAKYNELYFVGFCGIDNAEREAQHVNSLKKFCTAVEVVPFQCSKLDVLKARLRSMALYFPELASLCSSEHMTRSISAMIDSYHPDVCWIQFPQMAQYVRNCISVPAIMDVQDAYTLSGFRHAKQAFGLKSFRSWLDWVCWARYESEHYPQFSSVLTLSEQDALVLRALTPGLVSESMGLPLADGAPFTSVAIPMRIGFAGAFGHRPNIEGLRWFLDQVWPLIKQHIPNATFVVAGRNPPSELLSLSLDEVEFVGYVPDIFEFYSANAVTVIPLVSGGGVKIKTVEAMLAGGAVVSTRIGVEGMGVVAGEQALVEDEAAAFANAVVLLLSDPDLRARIASSAQLHAAARFSASAWCSRIENVLSRVVQ
jgi:polysaccharide biosynthesis protein PslH